VLGLVAVVATAGCAASAHHAGPAGPASADGTLKGRLVAVGGPPGPARPLPGTVVVTGPSPTRITVGSAGTFSVALAPGTYTLTGTNPQFNAGAATCRATDAVVVVTGATTSADVVCSEK